MSKSDMVEKSDVLLLFPELNTLLKGEKYTLKQKIAEYEKEIILEAHIRGLSTTKIAKELGIGQSSVVRKLKKYLVDEI